MRHVSFSDNKFQASLKACFLMLLGNQQQEEEHGETSSTAMLGPRMTRLPLPDTQPPKIQFRDFTSTVARVLHEDAKWGVGARGSGPGVVHGTGHSQRGAWKLPSFTPTSECHLRAELLCSWEEAGVGSGQGSQV